MIAAVAAVVTVAIAYRTVRRAGETVREAREARKEARGANAEAARDRSTTFDRELLVQRLGLLSRIADLLRDIADGARREIGARDYVLDQSPIQGLLAHLDALASVFQALGGQPPDGIVDLTHQAIVGGGRYDPERIVTEALSCLEQIDAVGRREQIAVLDLRAHR